MTELPFYDSLVRVCGEKNVLTSLEDLIVYAYDASAPATDQIPAAVVLTARREDVAAIIRLAN